MLNRAAKTLRVFLFAFAIVTANMGALRVRRLLLEVLVLCCAGITVACSMVIRDPFAPLGNAKVPASALLSRAEALEDLDALMRLLDHVHPDPYRFRARDFVGDTHRQLAETMPASLTRIELCLHLSRLLAAIDDGHTSMSCNALLLREWKQAADAFPPEAQRLRMFPLVMRLDEQQHLIVWWPNIAPEIERGDRLLRLNGHDADALLAGWAPEWSHDTDAGRMAEIAGGFRLQLAVHSINPPYHLTVAAPGGASRDVIVEGEPVNYIWQPRPTPAPAAPVPPLAPAPTPPPELRTAFFNYRIIGPGIAYMDFFSLFDRLDTTGRFPKAVARMFERIATDQPRVLIIDVRRNGGGEDSIASELLRHITGKPFRLLASTQVKRSWEVRAFAKSMIRIPFRWLGLQYMVPSAREYFVGPVGSLSRPDERPVMTRPRAEPFFAGPVCVLTGPFTFSAGSEFADAVKAFGLATVVGENTGGQPNSFGNDFQFLLPRSGLTANIATARSLRASGDAADFSAVKPDIVVRTTAADIKAGFDPVLERAKRCPERAVW